MTIVDTMSSKANRGNVVMRMKRSLSILSILVILLCTFSACEQESITVPETISGRIETNDDIYIDTKAQTMTFGADTFVVYGEERIDIGNTTHDISNFGSGRSLYFHPHSKSLSTIDAVGNIYLGTLRTPISLSELNIPREKLFVDGLPVTWTEHFLDKKVVCLGDNMTEGVGTDKVYYEWLAQLCGFSTVTDHGLAGSCIAPKVDALPTWEEGIESFYERYDGMEDDADAVIVFGGVNDWVTGRELGTISDTGTDTFYGAMDALCAGLKEKYPTAEIFVFSSPQNNYIDRPANELGGTEWAGNTEGYNRKGYLIQDYADAMEEVCALYDIPFYSLTDALPWGAAELGDNASNSGVYGSDGLHPNAEGHALIALEMADLINASVSPGSSDDTASS